MSNKLDTLQQAVSEVFHSGELELTGPIKHARPESRQQAAHASTSVGGSTEDCVEPESVNKITSCELSVQKQMVSDQLKIKEAVDVAESAIEACSDRVQQEYTEFSCSHQAVQDATSSLDTGQACQTNSYRLNTHKRHKNAANDRLVSPPSKRIASKSKHETNSPGTVVFREGPTASIHSSSANPPASRVSEPTQPPPVSSRPNIPSRVTTSGTSVNPDQTETAGRQRQSAVQPQDVIELFRLQRSGLLRPSQLRQMAMAKQSASNDQSAQRQPDVEIIYEPESCSRLSSNQLAWSRFSEEDRVLVSNTRAKGRARGRSARGRKARQHVPLSEENWAATKSKLPDFSGVLNTFESLCNSNSQPSAQHSQPSKRPKTVRSLRSAKSPPPLVPIWPNVGDHQAPKETVVHHRSEAGNIPEDYEARQSAVKLPTANEKISMGPSTGGSDKRSPQPDAFLDSDGRNVLSYKVHGNDAQYEAISDEECTQEAAEAGACNEKPTGPHIVRDPNKGEVHLCLSQKSEEVLSTIRKIHYEPGETDDNGVDLRKKKPKSFRRKLKEVLRRAKEDADLLEDYMEYKVLVRPEKMILRRISRIPTKKTCSTSSQKQSLSRNSNNIELKSLNEKRAESRNATFLTPYLPQATTSQCLTPAVGIAHVANDMSGFHLGRRINLDAFSSCSTVVNSGTVVSSVANIPHHSSVESSNIIRLPTNNVKPIINRYNADDQFTLGIEYVVPSSYGPLGGVLKPMTTNFGEKTVPHASPSRNPVPHLTSAHSNQLSPVVSPDSTQTSERLAVGSVGTQPSQPLPCDITDRKDTSTANELSAEQTQSTKKVMHIPAYRSITHDSLEQGICQTICIADEHTTDLHSDIAGDAMLKKQTSEIRGEQSIRCNEKHTLSHTNKVSRPLEPNKILQHASSATSGEKLYDTWPMIVNQPQTGQQVNLSSTQSTVVDYIAYQNLQDRMTAGGGSDTCAVAANAPKGCNPTSTSLPLKKRHMKDSYQSSADKGTSSQSVENHTSGMPTVSRLVAAAPFEVHADHERTITKVINSNNFALQTATTVDMRGRSADVGTNTTQCSVMSETTRKGEREQDHFLAKSTNTGKPSSQPTSVSIEVVPRQSVASKTISAQQPTRQPPSGVVMPVTKPMNSRLTAGNSSAIIAASDHMKADLYSAGPMEPSASTAGVSQLTQATIQTALPVGRSVQPPCVSDVSVGNSQSVFYTNHQLCHERLVDAAPTLTYPPVAAAPMPCPSAAVVYKNYRMNQQLPGMVPSAVRPEAADMTRRTEPRDSPQTMLTPAAPGEQLTATRSRKRAPKGNVQCPNVQAATERPLPALLHWLHWPQGHSLHQPSHANHQVPAVVTAAPACLYHAAPTWNESLLRPSMPAPSHHDRTPHFSAQHQQHRQYLQQQQYHQQQYQLAAQPVQPAVMGQPRHASVNIHSLHGHDAMYAARPTTQAVWYQHAPPPAPPLLAGYQQLPQRPPVLPYAAGAAATYSVVGYQNQYQMPAAGGHPTQHVQQHNERHH